VELWLFLGIGFLLLVLLAARNGAFGRRRQGDESGSNAFPQVASRNAALQVRDPRAQLPAGDRLGGRGPGDGRGD
jgi:hypothetical protein